MIEVKNLVKKYPTKNGDITAINNINLTINDGEIYGIIGLSGAGKSSLVRCINLLEQPTSGEIIVDGVCLSQAKGRALQNERKKIGMVFQHFNLLMNKTIFENIAFPMRISKKSKEEIAKRVPELLELVGLSDKSDAYPANLSGGQKQRVGIARALATSPSLIMCDEATSALDPATTKQILELLKEVNEKLGITIIIITHEMDVIKSICDKVAIMEYGNIIESGTVNEILLRPKTQAAKDFFGRVDLYTDNKVYKKAIETNGVLISAIFEGEFSVEPYISRMIKNYDIEASILLGNIEDINHTLIGHLVLKLEGETQNIESAIKYLKDNKISVEVVEYGEWLLWVTEYFDFTCNYWYNLYGGFIINFCNNFWSYFRNYFIYYNKGRDLSFADFK